MEVEGDDEEVSELESQDLEDELSEDEGVDEEGDDAPDEKPKKAAKVLHFDHEILHLIALKFCGCNCMIQNYRKLMSMMIKTMLALRESSGQTQMALNVR